MSLYDISIKILFFLYFVMLLFLFIVKILILENYKIKKSILIELAFNLMV
jgi:hypothetical protein